MHPSLLPSNATEYELALEQATARISDIQVPISDLWSASDCPASLLPWLAWALSVDEWSEDFDESQQRVAIENSLQVHTLKGTVKAVKDALKPYGATVVLTEWWEKTPQGEPYSFDIDVVVSGGGAENTDFLDSLKRSIDQVKPVRSYYSLITGVQFTHTMGLAGAMSSVQFQTFEMVDISE